MRRKKGIAGELIKSSEACSPLRSIGQVLAGTICTLETTVVHSSRKKNFRMFRDPLDMYAALDLRL